MGAACVASRLAPRRARLARGWDLAVTGPGDTATNWVKSRLRFARRRGETRLAFERGPVLGDEPPEVSVGWFPGNCLPEKMVLRSKGERRLGTSLPILDVSSDQLGRACRAGACNRLDGYRGCRDAGADRFQ